MSVALFLWIAAACGLPTDYEKLPSHALTDTADTRLGVYVADWVAAHGGKPGFYALPQGLDALGDPRSIDINTEMGVLIDSEEMTRPLVARLLQKLPLFSYRLALTPKRKLRWHAWIDGEPITETSEPQAGCWLRFKAFLQRIVPESQL